VDRNAIYRYLIAAYGLVAWWTAEGREAERARGDSDSWIPARPGASARTVRHLLLFDNLRSVSFAASASFWGFNAAVDKRARSISR
jgi:hypothetical protein